MLKDTVVSYTCAVFWASLLLSGGYNKDCSYFLLNMVLSVMLFLFSDPLTEVLPFSLEPCLSPHPYFIRFLSRHFGGTLLAVALCETDGDLFAGSLLGCALGISIS